ncbi:hypothetical protein SeMB42_g03711 [Synchytrium endobioticum]|uniref:FAD/NAD(P)-binding domain-containing protein n=1 Tax=Synchytrium endobioticum TaxID=286115 RepID=A0A507CCC1_9FUNG|nr:hypothetical protein SeLEV6574_g07688 [Synchytrium endobioticum]TPX46371.1 hypothetical protein SeMB42_g03711 [Synchytrium endobioticum]
MVKIVVVGGGFAGIAAVNGLVSLIKGHPEQIDLTLIEKRHGFITHNFAAPRAMADTRWSEAIFVATDALFSKFSNGNVLAGTAIRIEPGQVVLDDGTAVPFDYAVLAMGSDNDSKTPCVKRNDAIKDIQDIGQGIKQAKTVVIVGAGPVGVELAGEIAAAYPDKKVTLISSNASLGGPQYKPSLTKKLSDILHKLHVDIVFNERVVKPQGQDTILANAARYTADPASVTTESGKTYEAEFVFLATGNSKLNTGAVDAGLGKDALNDKTEVKVRETLQLVGHDNIFALGDIADVKGSKVGWVTSLQAPVVAKNLHALINNKKPTAAYKGQPMEMMSITLGKDEGATLTPIGVLGSWATRAMKSKQLFLPATYQSVNAKVPEGLW